jgi:Zn-dependent protease with chaperone function
VAQELRSRRLKDISPKAYEHPADRAATAALQSVPGLDAVVRKLVELQYERALRQTLLAGSVRVGPRQLPEVWSRYERVLEALDMPDVYDLYVTNFPLANAAAIGAGKPMIVVNSGTEALFESDELETVIGHEVGHILSDHVLYRTALLILVRAGSTTLPLMAGLPLRAVRAALLEWFRAAELSCDRAATLATRDPLLSCRTLMVLAGGVPSRRLDLDAFLEQASEYREWASGWDRVSRFVNELNLTHAYPVRRVADLRAWVWSGDYDRIAGGAYRTRDSEVDARAEAGEAVDFYKERFRRIIRESGDAVTNVGDQVSSTSERLSDWFRRGGAS